MKYISLFSGIEAATVAWQTLGWEPVAYAEIEPFPKAVLKHHYPNVPDLGDMTKVNWKEYHHAADVVVGGSPCQAFSIAGLRKALDDPRGQLMLEYQRKYNEYGCPMCGRLPVIKASQTEKYHESRKVRTTLTVYRLQCPRGHISTSWFSHAALASRQWKELVDEYKGKDTK